jgi:phosphomannomutase/phosphoglucomutase
MLEHSIFREYDIRGLADLELPDAGVEQLGRGLGTFLRRNKGGRVNVGRDVRLSSPRLLEAIVRGLRAAGCDVTSIGAAPTPLLYYSVHRLAADGGVMITGSHNPPEYNGFKTMMGDGTIYGPEIQEVARIVRDEDYESGAGGYAEFDALTPYVAEIAPQFKYRRRVKAVFDTGNGVAGPALRKLLPLLNVEPVELFFEPDGWFPNHHPDPTLEPNLAALKRAVAETGADLGLAFDGDGDRLGAVDERGNIVWGDVLMLIFGREILTRKPGATFIGEVKCSQVMYDELRRLGANVVMYKTGHSLIKAKMKELHAELAGEIRLRRRAVRGLPADRDRRRQRPSAVVSDRDAAATFRDAGAASRLPRREEIRGGRTREGVLHGAAGSGRRGRRADAVPARLGVGARIQHTAGAGAAFRGYDAGIARHLSPGSGSRGGRGGSGGVGATVS